MTTNRPPARFYGIARVDGQPAPAGTAITAWVNGNPHNAAVGEEGRYVLDAQGGTDGERVRFTIGALSAEETGVFEAGAFIELNLSAGGAAPPAPPSRFFGTARVDGKPAAAGIGITAWVRGKASANAAVRDGGSYSIDLPSAATDAAGGVDGDTVQFTVGDRMARETGTFQGGGFIRLDLSTESGDGTSGGGTPFVVRGRVTQRDGNPVIGVPVRALAKGVTAGQDRSLGATRSGEGGAYRIAYESQDRVGPDLVVEVLARDGERVAARSPLIVEAAADQVVDLLVESDAIPNEPEFRQIAAVLDPLLGGAALDALDSTSVSYLTGKTGVSPVRIAEYIQARRFAAESEVPAEAYYGLLRANVAPNRAALAAQDNGALATALKQVAAAGIVDAQLGGEAETARIVERLNREVVGSIIEAAPLPDGRTTIGAYLDIAGLDQGRKRIFVEALQDNEGHATAFWDRLARREDFGAGAVRSAQIASQLGTLTLNNAPLARTLHARIAGREDEPLRALVAMRQEDWLGLIREHRDGAGNPIIPAGLPAVAGMEPAAVYARTMARMVEDSYPTATLAARVSPEAFEGAGAVRGFLANNPAFEMRRESVRHFARANNLELGAQELHRLEGVQRVFNLAPRFERAETVSALLSRGVDSAWQVRSMGFEQFSTTFAPIVGGETARQIYATASQRVATATVLYAKYGTAFDNLTLNVIPNPSRELSRVLAEHPSGIDFPTWEGLFGSADTCACEHCDSIFSPSAYLVTILKFLRDRGALARLFERRPDIGTVELNCHNTNTTLPYVDLVNEVLEKFLVSSMAVYQTEGEAPALRVHPEHLDPEAYRLLEEERVYPWTAWDPLESTCRHASLSIL